MGSLMDVDETERLGERPSTSDGAGLERLDRERYVSLGELAQGGIGRISRAHDGRLKRHVALKELLDPSPEAEERFVREALVTARLQHPAIVPVYDAGRWPTGEAFYAMKLVSGRSLAEVVDGARSFEDRLALLPHVLAVAEAIAYAHSEGIIHRDLKPGNVLVGAFGETVVIDWGIAKDLREADAAADSPEAPASSAPEAIVDALTMVGAIMGTPAYMPPEQAAGEPVDERADVYALGAILYHVLAGDPPYEGKNSLDIVSRVLQLPPPPLAQKQEGVPPDLLTIVEKAMARASDDRYPTAKELAEDLRRFQRGQIVRAHQYSRKERLVRFVRRYRAPLLVAAAAFAVVAVVAVMSLLRVFEARRIAEAERDRASEERERAEQKQAEAEAAHRSASEHADDLTLLEARAAAARDPNEAIAYLESLSAGFGRFGEARLIAADAEAHGVAKILRGHGGPLTSALYSPDGSRIVTSSDDRTLRVWDAEGKLLRVLEGHTDEAWMLDFSRDGERLLSTGKDGTLRLWDVEAGTSRVFHSDKRDLQWPYFLPGETSAIAFSCGEKKVVKWDLVSGEQAPLPDAATSCPGTLAMTRDRRTIAFPSESGGLRVLDLETGRGRTFSDKGLTCMTVAISPDGRRAGCAQAGGRAGAWDVASGKRIELPGQDPSQHGLDLRPIAFSNDGTLIAWGGHGNALHVVNVEDGSAQVLGGHRGPLFQIVFSEDDRSIATVSSDHTVALWDLVAGRHRKFHGFRDQTSWVAFSPDRKSVLAASWDHTARIFPLETPGNRVAEAGDSPITAARFSADGGSLLSVEKSGAVRIHDVAGQKTAMWEAKIKGSGHTMSPDGNRVAAMTSEGDIHVTGPGGADARTLRGPEGRIERVVFSADGKHLVSLGAAGAVRLWDLETGEGRLLHTHEGPALCAAFSPNGREIASGGVDRLVRVWSDERAESLSLRGHLDKVEVLLFLPDGRVVSGGFDHSIRIWDPRSSAAPLTIEASGLGIASLLVSADGATLYSLGGEPTIRRWEVETGRPRPSLRGHESPVTRMILSPDGGRLASASSEGVIRVWDLASGESRTLEGHQGLVTALAFSPRGDRLGSAGEDGTVRLWADDLPTDPAALRAWLAQTRTDTAEPASSSTKCTGLNASCSP
jgi:eukaryotic-like serine/threonine-protein kinase